jgi:hypothetical protein
MFVPACPPTTNLRTVIIRRQRRLPWFARVGFTHLVPPMRPGSDSAKVSRTVAGTDRVWATPGTSGRPPDIDPDIAFARTIDRRVHVSVAARPAALLEREHEIERLGAGMGKSRLLEDARVRAAGLGFRVLEARATELEQGFP